MRRFMWFKYKLKIYHSVELAPLLLTFSPSCFVILAQREYAQRHFLRLYLILALLPLCISTCRELVVIWVHLIIHSEFNRRLLLFFLFYRLCMVSLLWLIFLFFSLVIGNMLYYFPHLPIGILKCKDIISFLGGEIQQALKTLKIRLVEEFSKCFLKPPIFLHLHLFFRHKLLSVLWAHERIITQFLRPLCFNALLLLVPIAIFEEFLRELTRYFFFSVKDQSVQLCLQILNLAK